MISIIPKPTDRPDDNSTGMVLDELKKLGVPFRVIYLESIDPFDHDIEGDVIWACGIRQNGQNFEVLQALALGNRIVNTPDGMVTCASKVATSARLLHYGIPTPVTFFGETKDLATDFIEKWGSVVYKPVYGFDGNGITLLSNVAELMNVESPFYLQEYIPSVRDFRIFVIEEEAVGAIMRQSDSLTHNIHQGGIGKAVTVDDEMADLAVRSAKAVGVDYGGVDLIERGSEYTVLEVNGTPNWHSMTAPIPKLMAEFLVRCSQD
jgi:ribosomal protein S6--L-glutamate ligase